MRRGVDERRRSKNGGQRKKVDAGAAAPAQAVKGKRVGSSARSASSFLWEANDPNPRAVRVTLRFTLAGT